MLQEFDPHIYSQQVWAELGSSLCHFDVNQSHVSVQLLLHTFQKVQRKGRSSSQVLSCHVTPRGELDDDKLVSNNSDVTKMTF